MPAYGTGDYEHFYPRSPCGERQQARHVRKGDIKFLSTLSLRRATAAGPETGPGRRISIHALLAESDRPFVVLVS